MYINTYEETTPEYFRDKENAFSIGEKKIKIPKVFPYVAIRDLNKINAKKDDVDDVPQKNTIEIGIAGTF